MKFFSKMIGAFDSVMLVVTTAAMIAPFLFALAHPGRAVL
jgi:hypothetical protein